MCSVFFDRGYTRVAQRKLDMKQARELTRHHASVTGTTSRKSTS